MRQVIGKDPGTDGVTAMRVLVVEDEPALRTVVARALREEGYAVDEADDGDGGLFKASHHGYDAVVLDLMLPKLDGLSLLRRLRPKVKVPVLILTARDAVADRVGGLDAGADDYLVKPFDLTELLARVRALIRRGAGEAANEVVVGDVTLDLKRRVARRSGADAGLTAFEFNLVEYLALRRGSVVSRTSLYEHLFDENEESLSNLLDVHVSNVRKKLGRDFIQTRRGLGYMIDD
jgi:two-component system OmpR family response regulator